MKFNLATTLIVTNQLQYISQKKTIALDINEESLEIIFSSTAKIIYHYTYKN